MLTAERCLWCGGPLLNGCTIPEMMFADDSLCGLCRSQLTLISHQVDVYKRQTMYRKSHFLMHNCVMTS